MKSVSSAHLTALALLCGFSPAGCGSPDERRPNVLLITVDTLRADHLGAWGDDRVDTPNLDAWAERSLVFENAFTAIPITTPSLGALLSGQLPRNHGALNNTYDLTAAEGILPQALAAAGYRCGAFLPSFLADKPGFQRGFEVYDFPPIEAGLRLADEVIHRAGIWMSEVEDAGDGPWFAWIHVLEPHSPYAPPADLEAKYLPPGAVVADELRHECVGVERKNYDAEEVEIVRALYRAEVEATDRSLASLFGWVEEHREGGTRAGRGDVLTVFTSDHGEMLYEHHDYVGHTAWLHEAMLRVPLMIRFPGGERAGERLPRAVNLIDLTPTLLTWLGIETAWPTDGVNVLGAPGPGRLMVHETFAPEGHYDQQALRRGALKLHRPIAGLREGSQRPVGARLYDWSSDPDERDDRHADWSDEAAALEGAFQEWVLEQDDPSAIPPPETSDAWRDALRDLGYTDSAFLEEVD